MKSCQSVCDDARAQAAAAGGDRQCQRSLSLTVFIKTWHVYTSFGIDNVGARGVSPWEGYVTTAYNSLAKPGDTLAVNLSTTPNDPRELAFARLSMTPPSAMMV